MEKVSLGNVPINSYPSGAAAAASMAVRGSNESGKWICVTILFIVSLLLTHYASKFWEWPVVFWTLSIILTINFIWDSYKSNRFEFNCANCGYLKCDERGKVRQLMFCTKWSHKPIQHFRLILWSIFFGIITLIFFFSNNFAARVFTLIFWVPGLSIASVTWIDRLRSGSEPHAYLSMPNHPPSCICRGTGQCPSLEDPGSFHAIGICSLCKGTRLCPAELERVAPELLKGKSDLILYALLFIISGYVIFGLLLNYLYG